MGPAEGVCPGLWKEPEGRLGRLRVSPAHRLLPWASASCSVSQADLAPQAETATRGSEISKNPGLGAETLLRLRKWVPVGLKLTEQANQGPVPQQL